jgi:hypothetical protein
MAALFIVDFFRNPCSAEPEPVLVRHQNPRQKPPIYGRHVDPIEVQYSHKYKISIIINNVIDDFCF